MEAAQLGDCLFTGAKHQVIGVGQNYLRPRFCYVIWENALDGALRTDRHEGGRVEDAVRRGDAPEPRTCGAILLN